MPGWMKWAISLLVGLALIALGWRVPFVLTTLHVLVSFLLVLVVLLQSGKAADLAGAFGGAGSQTAFGPRGAATFLSKSTTWCAIMFMLTSIALGLRVTAGGPVGGSVLEQFSKPAPKPAPPVQQPPVNPAPSEQTPGQQPPASQPPASQTAPAPQSQQPAPQTQPPAKTPSSQPPAKSPASQPPKP